MNKLNLFQYYLFIFMCSQSANMKYSKKVVAPVEEVYLEELCDACTKFYP